MKQLFIFLCALCFTTFEGVFCAGCTDDNSVTEETEETSGDDLELKSGYFSYSPEFEKWVIWYHIPGTIDSVNIYLISNPEKDYPEGISEVQFSGAASLSGIPPMMGGQTIYNIKLTKLIFVL
jgi:hypothetical protein